MLWWILTACAPGPEAPASSASCQLAPAHPLVVECEATDSDPLVLTPAAGPERRFEGRTGWGLKAATEYTWRIGSHQGSITTGPLPPPLEKVAVTLSGSPIGYDAVLLPVTCDSVWFVMLDADGDIVWFTKSAQYTSGVDAYEWAPGIRSLLVGREDTVNQVGLTGELDQRWTDFEGTVHHDLTRWGPYTYLLYEVRVGNVDVDGIHVYEDDVLLGSFRLDDHFDIESVSGGAAGSPRDWSHANGINATAQGEIILSTLVFDTVLAIDGDPASPTFLEILWMADGTGRGLPGADFVAPPLPGQGFSAQHNASLFDGELYLFDNTGVGLESRAARYRLHDRSVEILESWSMGMWCPVEGGAVPVSGGVVATCAETREVRQFALGTVEPVFELEASCRTSGHEPMNRGIPVRIE